MRELDRIAVDPLVMGGIPCIRGLTPTVGTVVGPLSCGRTEARVLELYPYLQPEDIRQASAYAARCAEKMEPDLVLA